MCLGIFLSDARDFSRRLPGRLPSGSKRKDARSGTLREWPPLPGRLIEKARASWPFASSCNNHHHLAGERASGGLRNETVGRGRAAKEPTGADERKLLLRDENDKRLE